MSNADAMAACHCRFLSPCLSAGFDDCDCDLEELDPASNAHDGAAQLARDGYAAYESGEPSDHATRLPESDDGIVDDEQAWTRVRTWVWTRAWTRALAGLGKEDRDPTPPPRADLAAGFIAIAKRNEGHRRSDGDSMRG